MAFFVNNNGLTDYEAKKIDLLKYAFAKRGVDEKKWNVVFSHNDVSELYISLVKISEKDWRISVRERSKLIDIGRFENISRACDFLYWYLTHAPSISYYREEWEKETGQEF